jgi:hypothetical protein
MQYVGIGIVKGLVAKYATFLHLFSFAPVLRICMSLGLPDPHPILLRILASSSKNVRKTLISTVL